MYTNSSENGLNKISTISGQQGFQWRQLTLEITSTSVYRILLEAIIGDGNLGDIAVDDITYTENVPCGSLTPITTTTTTTYPPTLLDCDFECNCPCSWNFDPTGNMNWIIQQGASEVLFTGPSADHTLQSPAGYYAYIKTQSPVVFNDSARLISPTVSTGSTGICLKFFYHMFGTSINRLNIYARRDNNLGKVIWQKIGEQGNKWFLGQVFVENLSNFEFVFEGVAGNNVR